MMPCSYDKEFSITCHKCQIPRKNGVHKQSNEAVKQQLSVSAKTVNIPLSTSPLTETEYNQQQQRCVLEAEELINKLQQKPDLHLVSHFVQRNKETWWPLKNDGIYLRICDLSGTIYMGQKFMLEGWQDLYLPQSTRMEVLGTLEYSESRVTTFHWIILVAENGHIYAYEDEELHLIANSLKQFVENGIKPTDKTYFYQHDVSDEESLQEDDDIKHIKSRTRDFIDKHADEFDDFLNFVSS